MSSWRRTGPTLWQQTTSARLGAARGGRLWVTHMASGSGVLPTPISKDPARMSTVRGKMGNGEEAATATAGIHRSTMTGRSSATEFSNCMVRRGGLSAAMGLAGTFPYEQRAGLARAEGAAIVVQRCPVCRVPCVVAAACDRRRVHRIKGRGPETELGWSLRIYSAQ